MSILYTIPKNFSSVFVIFSLTNCKFYTIFNYVDRFHGKCYNQTGLKGGFFMIYNIVSVLLRLRFLPPVTAFIMYLMIKSRYEKDVYRRLEETRTHKEFRKFRAEIVRKYNDFGKSTGFFERLKFPPMHIERNFLDSDILPRILVRIRSVLPIFLMSIIIFYFVGIFSDVFHLLNFVLLLLVVIIYNIYNIAEKRNAKRCLPKMTERERHMNRWKEHTVEKRPYTPAEKRVIFGAFMLRYGFVLLTYIVLIAEKATGDGIFALIGGLMCLAYGIIFKWHAKNHTHEFYCAMQNICHLSMTPFVHSPQFEKRAEKEARGVGEIFIVLGAFLLLTALAVLADPYL